MVVVVVVAEVAPTLVEWAARTSVECHTAAFLAVEWARVASIVAEWARAAPVMAVLIGTVLAQ